LKYEDAIQALQDLRDAGLPVSFGGNMFLDSPWVWNGCGNDDGWRWRMKANALEKDQMTLFSDILGARGLSWRRVESVNGEYITVYRAGYRRS